ncbi:hypothetical protein ELI_14155 [Erythrobacter litoralis HTCC2594]|uniref:Uncharacterized protein n=2 Tax=Erythrobacter litoralis TaxID=39960 RepID=Q2N5W8_ERYLH|nr:hypothetical protein ELI_14155 [Erythrobacter litoralis HTCC2594]
MGAYTGFKPFFFDGISVAFAGQTEFSTLMDRCYSNLRDSESLEVGSDMSTVDEFDESGTKWSVSADTNPLDDSKTVVASLAADEGAARFNGPVRLVARCQSNQTEAYAIWGEYLGDDSGSVYSEFKNVLVRIGDKDAITQRWDISTDKEATFAPSAINFLRELADSKRLVLQTVPYNEAPMTAIFDTTGARQAFQELSETCGWKID